MKIKSHLLFLTSALIALCLFIGLSADKTIFSAKAEQVYGDLQETPEADDHSHCFCGTDSLVGDHSEHTDVDYAPWNGGNFDFDGENADTGIVCLYLTENVVTGKSSCNRVDGDGILSIKAGQTIYLCLNGYSLTNGLTGNNSIDVCGTLILCDCKGSGTIGGRTSGANSGAIWVSDGKFDMYGGTLTGSSGLKNGGGLFIKGTSAVKMYGGAIKGNTAIRQAGGVFLNNTSTFEMFGGVISDNSAPDFGGGVIVDNGTTFKMHGGTIENNISGNCGGGVFVSGGTFEMNGGSIKGNKAANGGGVCIIYDYGRGSFTMNDGTISNNTAFGRGGGVYIWNRATFTMNGGTISDNDAAYGGGVCLFSAEDDKQKIYNVFKTNDMDTSDGNGKTASVVNNSASILGGGVCCFQYSVLNFGGNVKISDNENSNLFFADNKWTFELNNLSSDSQIGVSMMEKPQKGSPKIICGAADVDLSGVFFSDNPDYVVKSGSAGIELTADFTRFSIVYITDGEQTVPSQTKNGFGETEEFIVTSVIPTMTCHDFLGWAESADAAAPLYNAGDKLTVTDTKTLYAVWQERHDLEKVDEIAATCTENGTKLYYECKTCGKKFIDGTDGNKVEITSQDRLVTPSTGHKFGNWQETINPTTEKEGVLAHKDCEVCGKHFDSEGHELKDLTIAKIADDEKKSDDDGCSGSISSNGTIPMIAAAIAIVLLKRKMQRN